MFKIFVKVDKYQCFKSFISPISSISHEHSSSNAENSFVSNLKIADNFFCKLPSSANQHSIVHLSVWNEMRCWYSCTSVYWTKSPWYWVFFTSIWWVTVDMV